MRWVNHIAQSAAICAVFNPLAVPVAILGSTAPDWSEWLAKLLGARNLKHRGPTHYLATWIAGALFAHLVWDWRGWLFWFCIGGAVHWLGDSLTVTGAPFGWWSSRRTTLAGGRLRTGGMGEYVVTAVVVGLCAVTIWTTRASGGFMPYFYDWGGFYSRGLIDGAEWRANRWNWL